MGKSSNKQKNELSLLEENDSGKKRILSGMGQKFAPTRKEKKMPRGRATHGPIPRISLSSLCSQLEIKNNKEWNSSKIKSAHKDRCGYKEWFDSILKQDPSSIPKHK